LSRANDILTDPLNTPFSGRKFQNLYTAAREKEKRIYTDDEVALLPDTPSTHRYAGEWRVRKRSADRLMGYLQKKKIPLSILEVGCGNGWLSARLAGLKNSTVTGLDINELELNQAKRVFGSRRNIYFESAEIKDFRLNKPFDAIIFAAAIQYFPLISQTMGEAIKRLKQGGEIHILDSHFYHKVEISHAGQRSLRHYQSIGCGEMADFYFHHSFESIGAFHHKLLFNPLHFKNKLFRRRDPFPWICITAS
jgi:ubiquinone/menaquinone biosynthesis C-methylase UbiE